MKRSHGLIALAAVAGLGLALFTRRERAPGFTPEAWMQADPKQRRGLAEELLNEYDHLKGMSREEVEALLGPAPEGEQSIQEPKTGRTISLLVYPAGDADDADTSLAVILVDGVVSDTRLRSM